MTEPDHNHPANRWRLILGQDSDPGNSVDLDKREKKVDQALEGVYGGKSRRTAGLGTAYPRVHTWLEDVRRYFPTRVVSMIQLDAIERLGLVELLTEKEIADQIEPNIKLVTSILALKGSLPEKTKDAARELIERIVRKIEEKLKPKAEKTILGYLPHRSSRKSPRASDLDWRKTLLMNLKHYNPETGKIIPEKIYSFERNRKRFKQITILVDSSASMCDSLVYAGIYAGILARLPSLKTHLVLFDTRIADLTEELDDPVELIFGLELGGGTDIPMALKYARGTIDNPAESLLFLISDLYDLYAPSRVVSELEYHKNRGTSCICLTALDDDGQPDYNRELAGLITGLDIPVFGCSPENFPQLITESLEGRNPSRDAGMFKPS